MADAHPGNEGAFSEEGGRLWIILINLDALTAVLSRATHRSQLPRRQVTPRPGSRRSMSRSVMRAAYLIGVLPWFHTALLTVVEAAL